ncbi:MAG: hypothetical protein NVSMB46_00620 [Candidatus Saccharimonadales bacterium]
MVMADSIKDILRLNDYREPPEIAIIKQFIAQHYQEEALVTVQPQHIVISVKSAALAGSLRLQLQVLKLACRTEKRLLIRISS